MISNPYKLRHTVKHVFLNAFLMLVALTCLFPLFWMLRSAVMTKETVFTDQSLIPQVIQLSNFKIAWIEGNFGTYFMNSVIYTGSVVLGIVLISSLAAYAFSRLNFPGKNFLFGMFFAAMLIPLPGSFVPLVAMMNHLGLINEPIGYILCMINVQLAMSIYLLKTFFDKIPTDLEDAARIDGCNKLGIWWNVALPIAQPAIAVVIIINSLSVWNEFILANLILTDDKFMTLQTGLFKFQGPNLADYPVLMAGLTLAAVPIIVIYLCVQKYIISGLSSREVF